MTNDKELFSGSRPGETPSSKTLSERGGKSSGGIPTYYGTTLPVFHRNISVEPEEKKYENPLRSGRDEVSQTHQPLSASAMVGIPSITDLPHSRIVDNLSARATLPYLGMSPAVINRVSAETAMALSANVGNTRHVRRELIGRQVECQNKFQALSNAPGSEEVRPPLVKFKHGRPVGRKEQRREHDHFEKKRAKHQGQRMQRAVNNVTDGSGALLSQHRAQRKEPEAKVCVVSAPVPTTVKVDTDTIPMFADVAGGEVKEEAEMLSIGDEDWSQPIDKHRVPVHGMEGSRIPPKLVEPVEPEALDNLEVNMIENRDLRCVNVRMTKYQFDYLSFLGMWNDSPLSSAGHIYAEQYGLNLCQSQITIELPSTLVNELKAFWVNRRRDADLKEFNLSVVRCRKLCSELILTSEQYVQAVYYAPVIAYKESWEVQQQVGRVVADDYWQVIREPKWTTKLREFYTLAKAGVVGTFSKTLLITILALVLSTCALVSFLLYAAVNSNTNPHLAQFPMFMLFQAGICAPLWEEAFKRIHPWAKHALIWSEACLYVATGASIHTRILCALLHYWWASMEYRRGVFFHGAWNIYWISMYIDFGSQPLTICDRPDCVAAVLSGTAPVVFALVNSFCKAPKELKPTAKVRFVESEDKRLRKKEAEQCNGHVAQLAFDTGSYKPIVFASNAHNEKQALDARVLAETPVPEGFYCGCNKRRKHADYKECKNARFKRLDDYTTFVKTNLKQLIDIHGVQPLDFEEYLAGSNASPSVKKQLREAKNRLDAEGIDCYSKLTRTQLHQFTMRKSFVKVENNLYQTEAGEKEKAPRLIQGATAEFIVLVGPWIAALQKRLKRKWHKKNFLCFTSGVSAKNLGTYSDRPGWNILEDDVSAWDTSIRKQLCELEVWLCEQFGAPRAVVDLMTANIMTHGVTMHGWKYKVEGTRKSGDPFTSLFNSVHNALLHLFIYCDSGVSLNKAKKVLAMLIQGDDNLLLHKLKCAINWVREMRRLGFKSQGIPRKSLDEAEFCSGRFYCTKEGYSYGPKPGKLLAKFGYVVNPPPKTSRLGLMRGIALGLKRQVSFIPPLKSVVDRVLRLTTGVQAEYLAEWQKREAHKCWWSHELETTDEVMHQLYVQYQWGPTIQKSWDATLSKIQFDDKLDTPEARILFDRDTSGPQVIFGGFTTSIAA